MYASNEDEFNREDGDWVFLRQTPPVNTILHGAVNLVDHEESSSTPSFSDSSSSSKSERTGSSSSVSSTQHEHIQNDDSMDEQQSLSIIEDPVLASHDSGDTHESLIISEVREQGVSSEIINGQNNENETTPVINEYDLSNGGCDSSNELVSLSDSAYQSTDVRDQEIVVQSPSTTSARERRSHSIRDKTIIICGVLVLIFAVQLKLALFISSQQLEITKMADALGKANQRLNEMKTVSVTDIEQKLTKQLEEQFQRLLEQKTIKHEHEKHFLTLQINELYHMMNITQQNFTDIIRQLSDKNERFREQITELERRLKITEEHDSTEKDSSPEGVDCTKSSTPLDILLATLLQQTTSIAEDTSDNLSGIFEQLSASLSDLVDQRHEYLQESKRKLNDFAGSQAVEQVQKTIRQGVENLSSSLREARSTYASWSRTRAQHREQARMNGAQHEQERKTARRPWRWTFRRSHDREQMRHQTPVKKKHSPNKEYVYQSDDDFSMDPICTMKNWIERFFRQ